MMRADDGRIDHLQSRVAHSTSSEPLQDHIPDAAVGPPSKLPKDRIPVAELLRQIAPRRASSHQPKDRVEHMTMVARRSTAAAYQERLEIRPLIVRHQSANHRRSPQRAALNQFAILASIDLSTRPSPRQYQEFESAVLKHGGAKWDAVSSTKKTQLSSSSVKCLVNWRVATTSAAGNTLL